MKISKGVVAKYVGLATAAGLDWDTVQDWGEQKLSTALQPRSATALPIVVPDWGRIHRELDRKGVTLMLLWQEYVAAHPEGRTWRYTQFCEHYKAFAATLKRSMRQHRRAGEKMFIDYAGSTVALSDGIITHQLPIEHWHAWLGDPTVADAILDRLMQHCRRFSLDGESRRTGRAGGVESKLKKTTGEAKS